MTDQPQGRQLQAPPSRVPEPRQPKTQGFAQSAPPEVATSPLEASAPPTRQTSADREGAGLRKAQIYIDTTIDDYLWQIRAAAAERRLDVSSAAVARLAFHRLMADMTPDEVLKHLSSGADRQGPGRKRH
jgi:hypothetical protein